MTTLADYPTTETGMLEAAIAEGQQNGEDATLLARLRAALQARRCTRTTIPETSETLPTHPGTGSGHAAAACTGTEISERKRAYFEHLLTAKIAKQEDRERIRALVGDDPAKMSEWIDFLKAMASPAAAEAVEATPASGAPHNVGIPMVPDARYGIQDTEGTIRFYRVNTGKHGRWTGFQFVDIYASDQRYPVRHAARAQVLEAIAQDPKAAAKVYADQFGHCACCGRSLTDEASRERGIGPICWAKF